MPTRTKRTYNLSAEAVARVRELADRGGLPASQDGVVEMAIDHLYREIRDRDEAAVWARAADDGLFVAEMREIGSALVTAEAWPAE
jgi:hypothetical protein